MQTVALVACSSKKQSSPMPAGDLYCSPWFGLARQLVIARGAPWFILSAKYGLLSPDRVIAPYDRSLVSLTIEQRLIWSRSVLDQVRDLHPEPTRFIILAGRLYRDGWMNYLSPPHDVCVPMRGFSIGEQLQYLAAMGMLKGRW